MKCRHEQHQTPTPDVTDVDTLDGITCIRGVYIVIDLPKKCVVFSRNIAIVNVQTNTIANIESLCIANRLEEFKLCTSKTNIITRKITCIMQTICLY